MVRIFNHYLPIAYLLLLICEGLFIFVSIYTGAMLRFTLTDSNIDTLGPLWPRALIFLIVLLSTMTAMGMYDRHSRHSLSYIVLRVSMAVLLALMLLSFIFYVFPVLYIGRGVLLLAMFSAFSMIIISRILFRQYLELKHINQRVLVLGAGKKAVALEDLLRRKADRRGIEIVIYVDLTGKPVVNKGRVIKYTAPLADTVCKYKIDEIVLAVDDRRQAFPLHEIVNCRMDGIIVTDFVSFIEKRACKVLVRELDPSWLMYSDGFCNGVISDVVKRVFDIVVSAALLISLSPVLLVSILLMYLDDRCRGGVFYTQRRVGLNGAPFTIYKLRSMCPNSELSGSEVWASLGDDRVTRIGGMLRKYRIDELPQLINVIKGDMSFVGPRPERPEFVDALIEDIPYFTERHRVKPGITGWAQICYPYGASIKDSQAKLEYDLYYVKNCNLFLDLVVLFQTAQVVLFGKGAR